MGGINIDSYLMDLLRNVLIGEMKVPNGSCNLVLAHAISFLARASKDLVQGLQSLLDLCLHLVLLE